jgi:replicative DNA helicase
MEMSLQPLGEVLQQADERLATERFSLDRVWPTGFDLLDQKLNGGLRSGELVLLGGPQGLGKTTWTLQVARNIVTDGRPVVFFSYEHDTQTLLVRLVTLEAGQIGGIAAPNVKRVRATFEAVDGRSGTSGDRLADTESGAEAIRTLQKYGDRLVLHRSTGTSTDLATITAAIEQVRASTGQAPLVIVDYLQKVHVSGAADEYERVTTVAEGLKDLALDHDVPVLAVVAADKDGLTPGKRLRVGNLRGSSALAYEADTVLMLNEKFDVVARHHLVYTLGNAEEYRKWAVLSVEKNRNGRSGIDLEFRKLFDQCRFDTAGRAVAEQLVDDRIFLE